MDPKQKTLLIAIGSAFGLVIAALLVFLFMQVGDMSAAKEARDTAESELDGHYQEKPFPNAENRKIREADAGDYNAAADKARELLSHGLPIPPEETPSQFVTRIGERIRELNERQTASREVSVSTRKAADAPETVMDYAFGKYFTQGEIPSAENVPRLATQFAAIDHMCTLLLDQGATKITQVSRTLFDATAQAPTEKRTTSRRSRNKKQTTTTQQTATNELDPMLEKDGVTCESYTVHFTARYTTLASVLNAIAQDPLFIVVTDLSISQPDSIRNKVEEMRRKREAVRSQQLRRAQSARTEEERQAAEEAAKRPLFEGASPVDRMVTDPESSTPLNIVLKFDVYSVPPSEDAEVVAPAEEIEGK